MPLAELENLARIGKLKAEPPATSELEGLLRSGTMRLADARRAELNPESCFDLAFNAAHAFSLAALRWHGHRSENRFLVFQTLTNTLELPTAQWRVLDDAHLKRNAAEYEGDVEVDDALLAALLRVTIEVGRSRCAHCWARRQRNTGAIRRLIERTNIDTLPPWDGNPSFSFGSS